MNWAWRVIEIPPMAVMMIRGINVLKAGFLSVLVAIGKRSLQYCSGKGGEPKAAKFIHSLSINEKD
jgi:hypothetical protein